jgi:hypothetical protein
MKSSHERFGAHLLALLVLAVLPASAHGGLTADYRLQGGLASSAGAPPALQNLGVGNAFVTESVDGQSRLVLAFPEGNGVALLPTTGVIPSAAYTIVILFRLDSVGGYRKLLDFKSGTSDNGLYVLDGDLVFYNQAFGSGGPIAAGAYVEVALTRDVTGEVAGYVDGTQAISFADSAGDGIIGASNALRFFQDDSETGFVEASAGAVARIRLFDTALSPSEIAGLDPSGPVVAAVLPSSRAVQVGATATAFATIVNSGTTTAIGCGISLQPTIPADFGYQTTDPATNQATGTPSTAVRIGPGLFQTFVFSLTPTAPIAATDVSLSFDCANADPAANISGVNTLQFLASASPVPDIVMLSATPPPDPGIVNVPGTNGTGFFVVATVNVGASGSITLSPSTGGVALPAVLSICETDPATGVCLAPPTASVPTTIGANATPTFAVFVRGTGDIAFDPAANRVRVEARDESNQIVGGTSVAVRTQSE